MSLDYAILGLLDAGPQHGYAIGRKLSGLLGGIWPVNPGQVYATLQRLARDGAIAHAPASPGAHVRATAAPTGVRTRAARRRRFVLLPAGRRALRRWLERPVGCAARSDGLAARLALHAWAGDAAAVTRLLAARRARYAALHACLARRRATPPIRAARRLLDAELGWLALAEAVLIDETRPAAAPVLD